MSIINRLKRLYAKRSSGAWINYLRSIGMRIGEGTVIHTSPLNILIDTTRPWMIDIGENVQITHGVTILTHGYDWSVMKAVYGEVSGSCGKVVIGNNCFIGMNTTILKGTVIGSNSIVGAGSVLTGRKYPDNSVIAGNPARVICTLEEYRNKRMSKQLDEAKELVVEYYKAYGVLPEKHLLSEFFWLFEPREVIISEGAFRSQMSNMNNYEYSLNKYLESEPQFNGYQEFIDYCMKNTE